MSKICPSCGQRRPDTELFCSNDSWDLTTVPIEIEGPEPTPIPPTPPQTGPHCRSGHPVRTGDLFCSVCDVEIELTGTPGFDDHAQADYDAGPGTDDAPSQQSYNTPLLPTLGAWSLTERIGRANRATETWSARRSDDAGAADAILVLYPSGQMVDSAAETAAATLAPRVAPVVDSGSHEQRPFEVFARDDLRALADLVSQGVTPGQLRKLVEWMTGILTDLGRLGVRHRDISPDAILIDGPAIERLTLTRLGAARLSTNELDTAPPPELTRYAAPELLAGAVTAASDWWSLGIVILEIVTRGACFDGIEDQAFLMHVVAGGVEIPETLDPETKVLIQGLLVKDRTERWQGEQVRAWLAGTPVALPQSAVAPIKGEGDEAASLTLAGRSHRRITTYALAAASREHWEEARTQLVQGRLSAWLESFSSGERMRAAIRNIVRRGDLDDDTKLALALKHLNQDMPLVRAGEIITPAWLLQHPEDGHALITGPAPDLLPQGGAESWLVRLKQRSVDVYRRLKSSEIEVDEPSLRLHLLSTSRKQLVEMWNEQRQMMPDSPHRAIAVLLERATLRDEDLIILLSAAKGQFAPLAEVVATASELARRESIRTFDEGAAGALLLLPRRELIDRLDTHIEGFARSNHERIDAWIDQYRLERRIPLSRVLIALSLPADAWKKPPRQDYVAQLLGHFEKRIGTSVSRGALARMTIGRTSPRIDLVELGTRRVRAGMLLDHLIERGEAPIDVDQAAFDADPQIEHRLRRLVRHADIQRRETGINGLYLGFPFVLMRPRGDTAKPRIAPVLLWPVAIHAEVGQRARFRLSFDRDREEVRLNPALQGMLAPDALETWETARDSILSGTGNAAAVIDEFEVLADKVRERVIAKLPGADTPVASNRTELSCSAVLFHVMFVGQSIVNDIHLLQKIAPAGTGLETLLRSGKEQSRTNGEAAAAYEIDRFVTADSDPTQDRAVARARNGTGLVIEGPPGTGKSQTIVNLVADAIGRKKSLLLVCQKQAALDVVHKRLEREGLANRIMMVKDPSKDRRAVLEQIRHQLDHLRSNGGQAAVWQRQRIATVERISRLETQLNTRQDALRKRDEISGRTYRETISDLIAIDADESLPEVFELRNQLASTAAETADSLAEQCGALASLWLPAHYEGSVLHAMKSFAVDAATRQQCLRDIEAFALSERRRADAIDTRALTIEAKDAAGLAAWATQHAASIVNLDASGCSELGCLIDAFEAGSGSSPAQRAMDEVSKLRADIAATAEHRTDVRLTTLLDSLGDLELDGWISIAGDALAPRGWLARVFGGGKKARRKLEALLSSVSPIVNDQVMQVFFDAACYRQFLRQTKGRLDELDRSLGTTGAAHADSALTKATIAEYAAALAGSLGRVKTIHAILAESPVRAETIAAARQGTRAAFATLFDAIMRTLTLDSARRASTGALGQLTPWFTERWMEGLRSNIDGDRTNVDTLAKLIDAFPTLEAFQRFRARAAQLPPLALEVFALLRPVSAEIAPEAPSRQGTIVEQIIKREARLGWKQRIEAASPMISADEAEIVSLVQSLAAAEEDLKRINREVLAGNIQTNRIGNRAEWDDITRFIGPRSRRLREFLQLGAEIGLMELRPVWLMNPDVASRLLPLVSGLFDTIVYDEASQMPVEYALPTLYRARTVVVSGDEKQLPPSSFFAMRTARDEDGADLDAAADDVGEEEQEAAMESWNRREIQDCPNLLELSKAVLPSEQLQVHYRSQFRELITFSNAAFYSGALNVPVRHPEAMVDRHRPLEFIHVGGVYENRTNPMEADRIVAQLEQLWLASTETVPTTGVVTFNRDQADLIEECLEARAEASSDFRRTYVREVERMENGEDMGFFVKNVENVQGDERDHILFSTTFGRNAEGTFRRNFGVLGQNGGERRLNVAITRARQRITVFTSMPIDQISDVLGNGAQPAQPRDYLQLYLAYADAVSRCDHEHARRLLAQLGSGRSAPSRVKVSMGDAFVRSVAASIEEIGFAPVYAGDGSAFGIDLAIPHPEKGGFGIGIECDAADHPLLARPHAREVWRPSVMNRSLPAIHRITSQGWYHNRAREIARLRAAVEAAIK